jgi:hypothetical protein
MGESYSTPGRDVKCIQILVKIPEGKRPCGGYRHPWGDNIRMDVKKVG